MKTRDRTLGNLSEINITNLVDVSFVLLVIFILIAPMMKHGIDVNLPRVTTEGVNPREEHILTIDRDQRMYLDDQRLTMESLEGRVRDLALGEKRLVVFLKADEQVPYGFVVRVMGCLRKAVVKQLGMLTEPEE